MKQWKKFGRAFLLFSGVLAAVPVTCNSILAKPQTFPDDDYETVTALGSMLPQRVRKGEAVGTAGPGGSMSTGEFQKAQERIQFTPKVPVSGR